MDTDEEGDGSKKERRIGSGLYERYYEKSLWDKLQVRRKRKKGNLPHLGLKGYSGVRYRWPKVLGFLSLTSMTPRWEASATVPKASISRDLFKEHNEYGPPYSSCITRHTVGIVDLLYQLRGDDQNQDLLFELDLPFQDGPGRWFGHLRFDLHQLPETYLLSWAQHLVYQGSSRLLLGLDFCDPPVGDPLERCLGALNFRLTIWEAIALYRREKTILCVWLSLVELMTEVEFFFLRSTSTNPVFIWWVLYLLSTHVMIQTYTILKLFPNSMRNTLSISALSEYTLYISKSSFSAHF